MQQPDLAMQDIQLKKNESCLQYLDILIKRHQFYCTRKFRPIEQFLNQIYGALFVIKYYQCISQLNDNCL